ncbi:hypothetical protein C8J56DRAFT_1014600, partial [Mycena floridula]
MEHLEWPFTADDEKEILAAIVHIEFLLNSGQPESASVPAATEDVDQVGPHHARSNDYAHGSFAQIHGQNISAGTVGGSILSHNTINLADPAVRRKVDNLMERAIDAETSKKRQEFLDWISNLDFQSIQTEMFEKHAAGTGDWFFKQQDFVDWKDGKTKFLWCPGIPGAGKTILLQFDSSIIVEHLRSAILHPEIAIICIYCDYKRQAEQTATQLLGSILKQLVQQHPSISDHLSTLHKTCLSQGTRPSIAELFTALQTEVLLYSQVYIVVDALDECSENNQVRDLFFSTQLNHGLRSLSEKVHLLITSRDILWMAQQFDGEPKIMIEAHKEDLQTYIKDRLAVDIKLQRHMKGETKLEAEIVDQVSLKAAGMFLQAHLHLDVLATQLNRKAVRTALAKLPEGIMDSYDSIMARIKAQGEAEYELARRIFYWLVYAKQPLTIKE